MFTGEDQSDEVTTSKPADVHNTSAVSGGSGLHGHSDILDIIPKDLLTDIDLEKSDPACTTMITEELVKLKSKDEEEKLHLQEEEWKEARHKAQELWAKKKEKELQAKLEVDKKCAEQARLAKIKCEKELQAEKQKQQRYNVYKRKLKEDLCKKIEKEKEELEMHQVEMKYKVELTTQLREEYGISKMVPVNNAPVNNPAPPGNSNLGFSTIKTEPMDAKDLTNPLKKTTPTK